MLIFQLLGQYAAPVPIPDVLLLMQPGHLKGSKDTATHDAGIWVPEPSEEISLLSDNYDFAISLLYLDDAAPATSPPKSRNRKTLLTA